VNDGNIDEKSTRKGGSHRLQESVSLKSLHSEGQGADEHHNQDEGDDDNDLQNGKDGFLLHGYFEFEVL
jgi:hypothetical protein